MSPSRNKLGLDIVVNVALPWLVYTWAQPGMGRGHALMFSAIPPIVWSVVELARKRQIDALSILVIAGIALSLLAFLGGGSFRVLELREHLATGVMGLVFLGSVAIRRPLLGAILGCLKADRPEAESLGIQRLLDDRRRLNLLTLGAGTLLLVQTAVAIGLVFTLPVREFLIVGPILNYVLLGLFVVAVLYTRHRARTASEEIGRKEQASGNTH